MNHSISKLLATLNASKGSFKCLLAGPEMTWDTGMSYLLSNKENSVECHDCNTCLYWIENKADSLTARFERIQL